MTISFLIYIYRNENWALICTELILMLTFSDFQWFFCPRSPKWTLYHILFIISSLWTSALVRNSLDISLSPTTLWAMLCVCTRLKWKG